MLFLLYIGLRKMLFKVYLHTSIDRFSRTISAISFTETSPDFSKCFTPSFSIVIQNGHAEAIVSAPVPKASFVLSTFILPPSSSSRNILPPPAPQQNPTSVSFHLY